MELQLCPVERQLFATCAKLLQIPLSAIPLHPTTRYQNLLLPSNLHTQISVCP